MRITDLPNETLNQMIECLGRKDLHSLSLQSKHFSLLVRPCLFAEFNANGDGKKRSSRAILPLYFRSLVKEPELAKLVKKFRCHGVYDNERDYEELIAHQDLATLGDLNMWEVSERQKEWIHQKMLALPLLDESHRDKWMKQVFSSRNWDAVVAFLLRMISPNLQSISLENYGKVTSFPYIEKLFSQAMFEQTQGMQNAMMGNLTYVELFQNPYSGSTQERGAEWNHGVQIRHTIPFLKLNSVTQFRCCDLANSDDSEIPEDAFPTKELRLERSTIDDLFLGSYLNPFQNLRKLEWITADLANEPEIFTFGNIWEAIEQDHFIDGLEHLIIDDLKGEFVEDRMDNIQHLRNLKTLTIDVWSAYSVSRHVSPIRAKELALDMISKLPESLEHLQITHCHSGIYLCIYLCLRILFNKEHSLPNLKTVGLEFDTIKEFDTPVWSRSWEYFLSMAQKYGIDLKRSLKSIPCS